MTKSIAENLKIVCERIRNAENLYNRTAESVILMAVSKTQPTESIEKAYQQGVRHFGENYIQEALEKIHQLKHHSITWHFIGPIQSNKTRHIAENFDWVHTLDQFKTAKRINDQRPAGLPPINACIQINISEEISKSGIPLINAQDLIEQVKVLPNIRLRGLMAIPKQLSDFDQQRQTITKISQHLQTLKKNHPTLDTLSIGMSHDLEAAIAEGSTIVRIGTAIFGPRHVKKQPGTFTMKEQSKKE